MQAFLNLCRHLEFQIAFVGTIKTGKSALINCSEKIMHRWKKFIGIRHDLQRIADDTKNDAEGLLTDSQKSLEKFKAEAEKKRKAYKKIKNVSEQLNAIINQVEKKLRDRWKIFAADFV